MISKNSIFFGLLFIIWAPFFSSTEALSTMIVTDLYFSETGYDITSSDQLISIDIEFQSTDYALDWGQFRILQPNGTFIALASFDERNIIAGNEACGTIRASVTLPQYTPPGELQYDYLLKDLSGDTYRTYFPNISGTTLDKDIQIFNYGLADYTSPEINSIMFDLQTIQENSLPSLLTAYIDFTEDLSGVNGVQFRILDANSDFLGLSLLNPSKIINGSSLDGTMEISLIVPEGTALGNLQYDWIIRDCVGNTERVYANQIGTVLFPRTDFPEGPVITPAPVPEPSTMLLVGSGLIGLAGFRKKFKK